MRNDSTPSDPAAGPWQALVVGALAERAVATSDAELRRLARTLQRLAGAAQDATRRTESSAAGNHPSESFAHALDELAGD